MMSLLAILLLVAYGALYVMTCREVLNGNIKFLLYYTIIFFPTYTVFLTINFGLIGSPIFVQLLQYSKEVIIFSALALLIMGNEKFFNRQWQISLLDRLFLFFIGLSVVFFIIPLGEATLVNKAVYLKNILLIGIFYFFGRNVNMSFNDWNRVFQMIFFMTIFAAILVSVEKISGIHFHKTINFADFLVKVQGKEPEGTYDLLWTFEAEGGKPRFAAYFAHPLELSSAMLLAGAAAIIYLISVKHNTNRVKYLVILCCAILSLLFAYSRASLAAFFIMLGFIALLLKYYKILLGALIGILLLTTYIWLFASNEVRYFVIDTLTFQNSSSLTHLVDWLTAVDSILSNPMGIGLATSGNASGVEKDLIVGGENQFLIYGVQMGVIGMLTYLWVILLGIRNSWRAFRLSRSNEEGIVPFVAAATKFGFLLPLFTANAEVYIYISLVSWWLIGAAESSYQDKRVSKMRLSI